MVDSNDNKNGVKIVLTSDDESTPTKVKTISNKQRRRRLSTISLADIDGNAIEIETIGKNKKGKL